MSVEDWSSECDLVHAFTRSLIARSADDGRRRLKIIREFDPGLGRVDILGVWYDPRRLDARRTMLQGMSLTPFNTLAAYAMASLKQCRWVTISRFQKLLKLTASKAHSIIRLLAQRRLIMIEGDFLRARSNDDTWCISAIEAYEAKLSKWRIAVEQAAQHTWFASKSFVVMPQLSTRIRSHLVQECAERNVGVLLYQGRESPTLEVAPARRRPPMTHIGWGLNEMIFEEECGGAQFRPASDSRCSRVS
jgi:hypothetical protein